MTAQRRDADREGAESRARIWQMYADEIGLPEATSKPVEDPLRQQLPPSAPARRPSATGRSVRSIVAASAAGVLVIGAIAFGVQSWPSFEPAQESSPPTPAVPQGDAGGQRAEVTSPAASRRDVATADVRTPNEPLEPVRNQRTPENVVQVRSSEPAQTAMPRSEPAPTTTLIVNETKREPVNPTYRITFDFGSDVIDARSKRMLEQIVLAMKANPDWRLVIEGHTDGHGGAEYNRALSQRRAQAAKAHLEAAGISPRRLSAIGLGDSRPVAPSTGSQSFLNRRVDFHRP